MLRAGAAAADDLLTELAAQTAARGLHGRPAAQSVGARLAFARNALLDPALEVNQALRLAALDLQHVVTLLAYLARLAAGRADLELEGFLLRHRDALRDHERAVRLAAVAIADAPDRAITPAKPGLAGRLGHGVANAVGTAGEWVDGRLGR